VKTKRYFVISKPDGEALAFSNGMTMTYNTKQEAEQDIKNGKVYGFKDERLVGIREKV